MKVAVDLRSLHSSQFSGVEHYTVNVLERLLQQDKENSYTLFYNGFKRQGFENFHYINSKFKQTRYPNRLLNLSLKLFGRPKFEQMFGNLDVLFLPNLNLFAVDSRAKVILTVHDLSPVLKPELYNIKSRLWHWLLNMRYAVQRADSIIAVSEFTKHTLVESLKVPEQKIHVISLGVDHNLFNPRKKQADLRDVRNRFSLPGEFLFFVGTIEPRKNLLGLIQAFEMVKTEAHLVIAGKLGWKYSHILEAIERSPKRRRIHLLGYVSETDKALMIKLARAVIWPTLFEGFGLPALEALAVGTPLVTSQVTSLPEVVGDSALLVNPYSTTDIAGAIDQIVSSESLREQLISKGLERAQQFNWDKTAEQILGVINQFQNRSF
jgi:glycosyltransferase involved in cell wall biosynthesis